MANCPNCSTDNKKFSFILKKIIGKEFQCMNCQKPLYLNELKRAFLLAAGLTIIGYIILKQFFHDASNSASISTVLSVVFAFLITFILDVRKMNFSLSKPKKTNAIVEKEESKEEHLKAIYSKRNTIELEEMISNEDIAPEAKNLIEEIIAERAIENNK